MAKGRKTGGRVKGSKDLAQADVRAFCRRLVEDPIYQAGLRERMQAHTLLPQLQVMLWHYAYGKPVETHEHSGKDGAPLTVHVVDLRAPDDGG